MFSRIRQAGRIERRRPSRRLALCLAIVMVAAGWATMALPVHAQSPAHTSHPDLLQSYVVLDHHGVPMGNDASACSDSTGCATGIRFEWKRGSCFNSDRYPPIVIVWTVNHKVTPGTWPVIAPCSTGIRLAWGTQNHLTKATWRHAADPTGDGLAVCFQHAGQCSHAHCVTAGCLPEGVDGVDIFFQGADVLKATEWMRQGKPIGSAPMGGPADDVFWYGSTPPASAFPRSRPSSVAHTVKHDLQSPTAALLGRDGRNYPQTTTSTAPSDANGIDIAWFLPLNQARGPKRGCYSAGGTQWTSPPVAFEYLSSGALNARVDALTCPRDTYGNLLHFNHAVFSFAPSSDGTTNVLTSASANFDGQSLPSSTIPQPPAGTDGLVTGFHRDNYQNTAWATQGVPFASTLPAPGHTRLVTWHG